MVFFRRRLSRMPKLLDASFVGEVDLQHKVDPSRDKWTCCKGNYSKATGWGQLSTDHLTGKFLSHSPDTGQHRNKTEMNETRANKTVGDCCRSGKKPTKTTEGIHEHIL